MSIEKLKEQARRHEQKEEWQKALDEYKVAIKKLAEDEQPDIGLYNRVGDLYVRVGNLDAAVAHYEQSTRFTVAYEEPTGDEQADFAKMLSQFKEKVSENLGTDDVRAHHDLGTAYKEMGLLDEAVSEFQAALRASPGHLPTYELLGLTFMEMGQPEATVNSLERALEVQYEIEDELLGIYYYLALANQELGNAERAVELYEKVFSLDINFADVTERLRDLR
jgi:tetratricopeptide (TPR) repeat protein